MKFTYEKITRVNLRARKISLHTVLPLCGRMEIDMKRLIESIVENLNSGKAMVLVNIIASSGSTPRGAGAAMAVFEDGHSEGTIGGGAVEYEAQKQAKVILTEKASKMESYRLSPNDVADLGMICGGAVTVYYHYVRPDTGNDLELFSYIKSSFEKDTSFWLVRRFENDALTGMGVYDNEGLHFMTPPALDLKPMLSSKAEIISGEPSYYIEPLKLAGKVYIFGGGHVGQELVPVLSNTGFETVVYEDRENFTDKSLFNGVSDVILGDFTDISKHISIRPEDYVVIMTRGHQADYEVLGQALRTSASYIGCIGSSRKIAATKKRLIEDGLDEEALERLHSPIGIEILAETPAEIAISIAAQLIDHRAKTRGESK